MTADCNTLIMRLPATIGGYTVPNNDGSYTIVLNSNMTYERRMEAYRHEIRHIENGDFEKLDVQAVESAAHLNMEDLS